MVKKHLRGFIMELVSSDKTTEEKEIIAKEVMQHIGTSSLNTKTSHYDGKGRLGIFYNTIDKSLFRKEIKRQLSKITKRGIIPKQGKLERELKKGKLSSKVPKTSRKYEENPSPPPNQFDIKEACEYLKKEYDVEISQRDLKKIIQGGPLTRESLDDSYRFKLFELTPTILVTSKFKIYEVTINNKKGVPRYYCDHKAVLSELFKEKSK